MRHVHRTKNKLQIHFTHHYRTESGSTRPTYCIFVCKDIQKKIYTAVSLFLREKTLTLSIHLHEKNKRFYNHFLARKNEFMIHHIMLEEIKQFLVMKFRKTFTKENTIS